MALIAGKCADRDPECRRLIVHRHREVVGGKTRLAESDLAVGVIQAQRVLGVGQFSVGQQHRAGQSQLFGLLHRNVQVKVDLPLTADIDAEQLRAETLADRRCLEQGEQVVSGALRVDVEFEHRLAEVDHIGARTIELVALDLAVVGFDAQGSVDEVGGHMHVFRYRPVRQISQGQIFDLGARFEAAAESAERPLGQIATDHGTPARTAGLETSIEPCHRSRRHHVDRPEQTRRRHRGVAHDRIRIDQWAPTRVRQIHRTGNFSAITLTLEREGIGFDTPGRFRAIGGKRTRQLREIERMPEYIRFVDTQRTACRQIDGHGLLVADHHATHAARTWHLVDRAPAESGDVRGDVEVVRAGPAQVGRTHGTFRITDVQPAPPCARHGLGEHRQCRRRGDVDFLQLDDVFRSAVVIAFHLFLDVRKRRRQCDFLALEPEIGQVGRPAVLCVVSSARRRQFH